MVIQVIVTSLRGDSLELTLARESRISQLKREIDDKWGVPYSCQKLIKDGSCANDSDKVDASHYQMHITLESIGQDLERLPYGAISELSRLGTRGGDDVIRLLSEFIRHPHIRDKRFKCDVIKIMAEVTERGNPIAILALSECVTDTRSACRHAAIEMLAKVAEKGNVIAIGAFCKVLKGDDMECREIAVQAFLQIAEKGDQNAIDALRDVLSEDGRTGWYNVESSKTKVRLLAQLVVQGKLCVLQAIASCFECEALRDIAMWAIIHIATNSQDSNDDSYSALQKESRSSQISGFSSQRTDTAAKQLSIEAVNPYLVHGDEDVKKVAEETLEELLFSEVHGILSNLKRMPSHYRGRLFSNSPLIRLHALKALFGLRSDFESGPIGIIDFTEENAAEVDRMEEAWRTGSGYEDSVLRLVEHLQDASVRSAAAGTLSEITRKGDQRAICALFDHFDDQDDIIRMQVISGLNRIVHKGDAHVVSCLLVHLGKDNPLVRAASAKMLGEVALQYDQQVIIALCGHLMDENDAVKMEVASACLKLAGRGHPFVIQHLALLLESEHAHIRSVGVKALGELAEPGDECAINALCNHLQDVEESVRLESISALFRVSRQADPRAIAAAGKLLNDMDRQVMAKAVEMLYRTIGFAALKALVDNLDPRMQCEVTNMIEDMLEEE